LQVFVVFRLVIGDGRSVGDRSASSDSGTVGQDRFDERGLARVVGSNECDISKAHDIRHFSAPYIGTGVSGALPRVFSF
jgi:hypothetical protein